MPRPENRRRFPPEIRKRARKEARHRCETCGQQTEELEVHHRLPVSESRQYHPDIPPGVVRSSYNAKVLCPDCHDRENNISKTYHDEFAEDLKQKYNLR